ncbi:hypothetical protein ACQ4LE_005390 [Meloidogyne hapla]
MHLKLAFLLIVYFVGISCHVQKQVVHQVNLNEHGEHVPKGGDGLKVPANNLENNKEDEAEIKKFVEGMVNKVKQVEEKLKEEVDKVQKQENVEIINQFMNYVNILTSLNAGNIVENIPILKGVAKVLYDEFEKNKMIHDTFINAKLLTNDEVQDENFLTGIFNSLWKNVENNTKDDEATLKKAISVWKTFVSENGHANAKCSNGKINHVNNTRTFPIGRSQIRRKRENGCPTQPRHWLIILAAFIIIGLVAGFGIPAFIHWLKKHA